MCGVSVQANILREMNKAYLGFVCHQHRGDINTELLALAARNTSSPLVGESYPDGSTSSVKPLNALGNVTAAASSAEVTPLPSISVPSSSSGDFGTGPLSPIVEVSESPRVSVIESGNKAGRKHTAKEGAEAVGGIDQFAAQLAGSIIQGIANGKPRSHAPEKKVTGIDDFASQLTRSLFGEIAGKKHLTQGAQEVPAAKDVDSLASLAHSVLSSASQPPQEEGRAADTSTASAAASTSRERSKAEDLAKSIISDILSQSQGPSRPPEPPVQTVGQQSCDDIAVSALASGLAESIISEVMSSHGQLTSAVPRPTILVQSEKRLGKSESPGSSRSSSLTGQSLTLHEFTDDLVESTIKEGAFIAHVTKNADQRASELRSGIQSLAAGIVSASFDEVLARPKPLQPEGDELKEEVARTPPKSAFVAHGHHRRAPSPARAAKAGGLRQAYHRKRLAASGGETSDPGSDQESHINPLLLSTPSSRMSYAWSIASTRDEDSRPVSPTDMDKIALGFASTVEEFAGLFTEMVFSDAIAEATGFGAYSPRQKESEGICHVTVRLIPRFYSCIRISLGMRPMHKSKPGNEAHR